VYTDGIVECTNPEGEFFDEARLETALAVNQNVSLFELKRDLWQTLGYFAQGNRGQDDCSFICLELNEA
jgi:serine phosphatase RsbU (regulator of sigma subunit)